MKRPTSFISYILSPNTPVRASLMRALLILAILLPSQVNAAFSKHSTSIVDSIESNFKYGKVDGIYRDASYLVNPTEDSYFFSGVYGDDTSVTAKVNFTVMLKESDWLTEEDDEDLVVYLKRPKAFGNSNINEANPVEFEVKCLFYNASGSLRISTPVNFKIFFQYRGPNTNEYSGRISIKSIFENNSNLKNQKLAGLRLYAVKNANDNRYSVRNNGVRDVVLNSLDILKIPHDAPYSDTFVDNFHLNSDYYHSFEEFEFVNTKGIADSRNSIEGWEMLDDSEIERLKGMGITYPDYSFITSQSDKSRNPYPLDPDQKRQATHTVEHIIYAMPGDVIPLYPYYGLSYTKNFKENFSHWYDYKSGKIPEYTTSWSGEQVRLLDFLTDPSKIQKTSNFGYFGGTYMNTGEDRYFEINSVDDYINVVNTINTSNAFNILDIKTDLNFDGHDNVPMINEDWHYHFYGIIKGNGHTISNLHISRNEDKVGLVKYSDGGATIENLIIDSSCSFTGTKQIGLVAYHCGGNLTIRNIRMEATCYGTERQAAGILGESNENNISLTLENIYVGGKISSASNDNAAIIGYWKTDNNTLPVSLKNVVVTCELLGCDTAPFKMYIRSNHNLYSVSINDGVATKGIFRFENCYGIYDPDDICWNTIPSVLSLSSDAKENFISYGWKDEKTPPVSDVTPGNGVDKILIKDEADYIKKINDFNNGNKFNVYIELEKDLDFKNYDETTIPMIGQNWDKEFQGTFNGKGHTIKNLKICRNTDNVGLFRFTSKGAIIENLIIDSSCVFEGNYNVGLVGQHRYDPLVVKNVRTEATVRGTRIGEHAAAGILGMCNQYWGNNIINLENVYIGGVIGNTSCGSNNAPICGWISQTTTNDVTMTLTNVIVNCRIYNTDGQNRKRYFRHSNPDAPITGPSEDGFFTKKINSSYEVNGERRETEFEIKYKNCFGSLDVTDIPWQPLQLSVDEENVPLLEGWINRYTPPMTEITSPHELKINDLYSSNGDRKSGTVATFFCPRDPFNRESVQSLPFPNGEREYVIAADFSQTYDPKKNIDINNSQLVEPIIAFRHIFRIRDGKEFADKISGDIDSNKDYLRKVRKYVSVRNGASFQIRLDNPVPKPNATSSKIPPSHYYYVDENGEYRQVAKMDIKVLDGDSRKPSTKVSFQFDNIYPGYGFRDIDGVKYALGEGSYLSEGRHPDYDGASNYHGEKESEYYLLLTNKGTVVPGHYLVQIVAQDYNGNVINIKGTSTPLVLMEYDITVLPLAASRMTALSTLYTNSYKQYTPEEFDKKYGEPTVKIDFDEYMNINKLPESDPLKKKLISRSIYIQPNSYQSNPGPDDSETTKNGMQHTWFKWPVPWNQSTYSFGYNDRQDYGMYQLATHSENVVWKEAAQKYKETTSLTASSYNKNGDGTGLYDRKYYAYRKLHTEENPQQGYFYYVNAASDPGVTASLRINELCQGSKIVVSAWMAEFSSTTEKANLSFNFVAVLNDNPGSGFDPGERIILHKFLTGYVPDVGNWYNIYYEFTPRLAEFSTEGVTSNMVDHYELELDNNAKSSNGADYAIDDIRAYVVPPTVEAEQLSPACDNEEIRMQLASPFETLLEIAEHREQIGGEREDMIVYYTYLDKGRFDLIYDENKGNLKEAFDASIIEFNYNISDKDDRKYGYITFNGNFSLNPTYKGKDNEGKLVETEFGKAYGETKATGERMIVFESEISSGKLRAGKEYYVVFKSPLDNSDRPKEGNEAEFFNMKDPCANTCVVFITPSNVIKIDGKIQSDIENIIICENQAPVVQVNVWGYNDEGERQEVEKNVCFDWFYGTIEEFEAYNNGDGVDTHTLQEALHIFRLKYPDAQRLDGIKADEKKVEGEEMLEQWMLDVIKKASSPEGESALPKLTLYLPSFVMPPVDLKDNETSVVNKVVVLPIACIPAGSYNGDTSYLICSSPTELKLTVGNKTPILKHGLTDIEYPSDLVDVPLRVGLDQIRKETKISTNNFSKDMKTITVPVRLASSTDGNVKSLKRIKENIGTEENVNEKWGCVLLVQTNDPAYKDLGTVQNGEETEQLLWAGEITELTAYTSKDKASENFFKVVFDSKFDFKEGYFYSFRFQFEEDGTENDENVCTGQDVFTLKIVPKYQLWTGKENLNWNNDANWSRVEADEIKASLGRPSDLAPYLTNGARGDGYLNRNKSSYAPLDFTYVIVKDNAEAPYLQAYGTKNIKDFYSNSYPWPQNPSVKADGKTYADEPVSVGVATPLIQYDMAAFYPDMSDQTAMMSVGCRPWYANTCNEIHFKPGGTIMNQQELTYTKAWVDMELDHSRWYTVSSPLKEVYAGDFYLPTDGARQMTELYQDITFLKGTHDRFRPAVFQRGWDKGIARVYEIGGPAVDASNVRNVAVKTFWSHVYNDVKEQYGGGVGFSIKTDVSDMEATHQPDKKVKVLFRLPKADTYYEYWDKEGNTKGHSTDIARSDDQYRLNESSGSITVSTANPGNYFLVGNPFMTHMDIQKFLKKNEGLLEPKYWVITKSGQIAGSFEGGAVAVADPAAIAEAEDPTVVAPMQGFFVKTKEPAQSVILDYDESMMRRYTSDKSKYLTGTTRSEESSMLRIVAETDGCPSTAALLGVNNGSDWNVEAIDNRDLDIPSIVYTVGNGMALSINSVEEAEGTEIGVIADDGVETLLRFEGVECVDGLYLLDKAEHSLTPLEEGLEVAVEGAAAGRFFLTYGIADEGVMSGIEWSVAGGVLTAVDNANTGMIEVNVYDTMGRLVKHAVAADNVIEVQLESGIYVVEISTAKERETAKIRIRR